jgi:hypothetical protein
VKIVEACDANCRYFTRRRNDAGLLEFSPYQNIKSLEGEEQESASTFWCSFA